MTVTPRPVAICVVYSASTIGDDEPEFLLVSSRKHAGRWVFPKGGIEAGETSVQAALREAGEEAGLKSTSVQHVANLGQLDDSKPHKQDERVPSTTYHVELFRLLTSTEQALDAEWLEAHERERCWTRGYDNTASRVVWGRRADVLKLVIESARTIIISSTTASA